MGGGRAAAENVKFCQSSSKIKYTRLLQEVFISIDKNLVKLLCLAEIVTATLHLSLNNLTL